MTKTLMPSICRTNLPSINHSFNFYLTSPLLNSLPLWTEGSQPICILWVSNGQVPKLIWCSFCCTFHAGEPVEKWKIWERCKPYRGSTVSAVTPFLVLFSTVAVHLITHSSLLSKAHSHHRKFQNSGLLEQIGSYAHVWTSRGPKALVGQAWSNRYLPIWEMIPTRPLAKTERVPLWFPQEN